MRVSPAVGVIGLGEIGRGVAEGVLRAGLDLVVCDVLPEATATFAGRATVAAGPAELGTASDVIVVAVVDDAQVLAVLDPVGGALSSVSPGSTVLLLSTVAPATVDRVAAMCGDKGVGVVDCGVSGGPAAAAEGGLVAMVGGDDDALGRV
ncbi:MAG TPA: NAD(P)-binding domain-containing protein, partial [Acidimicrobiales bacterium]|nr:NAD(P)-binding domain-containing protein [Acidimicrobiales bacterium]